MFGTGASGELRPDSDVNVLVVLHRWQRDRIDQLREPLRIATAAINLAALFIMEVKLSEASIAFAEKFSDMRRRRCVLAGKDVITELVISRSAIIAREKQVLLNLILRLRNGYLNRSLRSEQAAALLADAAGPLRGSAATLAELEGWMTEPKTALVSLVDKSGESDWIQALMIMSDVRQHKVFAANSAPDALFHIIALTEWLHAAFVALAE